MSSAYGWCWMRRTHWANPLQNWATAICEYSIKHGRDPVHGGLFYTGPLDGPGDDRKKGGLLYPNGSTQIRDVTDGTSNSCAVAHTSTRPDPILFGTPLRGLQQASELKNVQAKLGCTRASLGSLSEATTVFDAERLKDIIGELGQQLQPLAQDKRLQNIDHTITLVDGSLIAALLRIMEASFRKTKTGSGMVKWRLHTHFELLRGVPTRIDVTPDGGGPYDEQSARLK